MPSPITQNLGSAIAGALNPLQHGSSVQRETAPPLNQTQIAQVTQVAASKTVTTKALKDADRSPQIPKRVEPNYNAKGKVGISQGGATLSAKKKTSLDEDENLDVMV